MGEFSLGGKFYELNIYIILGVRSNRKFQRSVVIRRNACEFAFTLEFECKFEIVKCKFISLQIELLSIGDPHSELRTVTVGEETLHMKAISLQKMNTVQNVL